MGRISPYDSMEYIMQVLWDFAQLGYLHYSLDHIFRGILFLVQRAKEGWLKNALTQIYA